MEKHQVILVKEHQEFNKSVLIKWD